MNKRISDMMDGFIDESVNIELSEQASSKRIKEAVKKRMCVHVAQGVLPALLRLPLFLC